MRSSSIFARKTARIGPGLGEKFCNHTFRATGITAYLKNDGELAKAQFMAAHASIRTNRICDRREEEVTLDEVERIIL